MREKKIKFLLKKILNGEKIIGEKMKKVLKEKWELLLKEIRKRIENEFGEVLME